jgi:Flp pilus assembly protein TadG
MVRRPEDRLDLMQLAECKLRAKESEVVGCVRNERGSSTVEFALSVTVLLTLVFGVLIMCLALYSYHFVAEAAREGARYAMVRGSSCTTYSGFTSACPVTSAQVQTYVRSLGFPGISSSKMTVTTTWPTTGSACTPSTSPCNNPGNLVRVNASYQFFLSIPFVPTRTLTMTSTSQMVIAD